MKKTAASVLVVFCIVSEVLTLSDPIRIGGVFNNFDEYQMLAFKHAASMINHDPSTLSRSRLQTHIEQVFGDDSFDAAKKTCGLLQLGIAAIFGPQSENAANHVQSICNTVEMPHIETRWDYKLAQDYFSVNLYPHPTSLGKAYRDILKVLQWKKLAILYDSSEGLIRLQDLLKDTEMNILVRHLREGDDDYRPLLKEFKRYQRSHIVLDVAMEKIDKILQQAATIGLMNEYYNYFITSLDFNQVNLERFQYTGVNITGIQLVDQKTQQMQEITEGLNTLAMRFKYNLKPITTETALIYDAVSLLAKSLDELSQVTVEELYCNSEDKKWRHGFSVTEKMKTYGTQQWPPPRPMDIDDTFAYAPYRIRNNTAPPAAANHFEVTGVSGVLKFDNNGFRTDFTLDILEMDPKELLKKVGTWTLKGANYTRTWRDTEIEIEQKLENRTLIVTTALSKPYVMLKEGAEEPMTTDNIEGFCVELIDEISKLKGFNYTFKKVDDGKYGSRNDLTGEWNGMVKELMDHKADLGIVDFTITYERETAVDFSMPFMNLGISIIYKKPGKKPPSLLSFMAPFSVNVWIYMATAYLGVSVLLFILARMTPVEWDCPYPCIEDPEELENSFTLLNSLWFIIGTFLCQGADIAPRAISTRIVAGIWWFFTLIMISSYTANLAAFLTVDRMNSPIEGAEDLAKQTKIKYGCKHGGSTYNFFRDSNIPTFQRMWATMSNIRPSVFPDTNEIGIDRVAKADGQYAFLMESSTIEYVVERNCDLMQVGGLLDSKSYGIALPPGSPYTGAISSAILKLKEKGILPKLKKKWWKQERIVKACDTGKKDDPASAAELGLENVGGVFVVMVGGIGLACVTACCEFGWKARKLAVDQGVSFGEEVAKELLFVLNCRENSKPVRKRTSGTETESLYGSSSSYGYSDKK